MKNRTSFSLIMVFTTMCLCNCTHPIIPETSKFDATQLPIVKAKNPVSVNILQTTAPKEFIIYSHGIHKYIVQADDLNNKARTSLEDMLKMNNVVLADNAMRKIDIAVVSADCPIKDFTFTVKCSLIIKAQAGDKVIREFNGKDTGARLENSVTEAANNALLEMLKDKEFIQYLTE